MNREQRRNPFLAPPKRTRDQWADRIGLLAGTSTGMPDDQSIVQLLVDVVVAEQGNLSRESLAVLCGLAAAHVARTTLKFFAEPKPPSQPDCLTSLHTSKEKP